MRGHSPKGTAPSLDRQSRDIQERRLSKPVSSIPLWLLLWLLPWFLALTSLRVLRCTMNKSFLPFGNGFYYSNRNLTRAHAQTQARARTHTPPYRVYFSLLVCFMCPRRVGQPMWELVHRGNRFSLLLHPLTTCSSSSLVDMCEPFPVQRTLEMDFLKSLQDGI